MHTANSLRISIITLTILLFTCTVKAQSASSMVIGSTGGYVTTAMVSVSYNVGETEIATRSQGAIVLTQGFEQPDGTGVGIDEMNDADLGLTVFPNPATDFVTIRKIEGADFQNVTLSLFDAAGKLTNSFGKVSLGNNLRIDMHSLAAGVYVLKLETEASTQNIRIVKMQL